jgi:hypothetical protein
MTNMVITPFWGNDKCCGNTMEGATTIVGKVVGGEGLIEKCWER